MTPAPPRKPRRRDLLVLLAALLLAALLAVAAFALAARSGPPPPESGSGPYRGSEPPAEFELPPFSLTSYRGEPVASASLAGDVVVLTILDAQCTDVCPILASVVAGSVDRLTPAERRQVRPIAISGDPAEDTPTAVRQFLRKQRAIGRLDYLVGSEKQLRPIWTAMQVLPSLDSGRDSLHSAPLRVYDRRGIWVSTLHSGADLSEENLLQDIRTALAGDPR